MLKLLCATKCSNNHMHPHIYNQDSLHFTITIVVLRGATLPHLKIDSLDRKVVGSGLPDPLVAGSISPDPLVAGFVSPDPLVAGSVSPDPKVAGSGSPYPKVVGSGMPDPMVVASSRPISWV